MKHLPNVSLCKQQFDIFLTVHRVVFIRTFFALAIELRAIPLALSEIQHQFQSPSHLSANRRCSIIIGGVLSEIARCFWQMFSLQSGRMGDCFIQGKNMWWDGSGRARLCCYWPPPLPPFSMMYTCALMKPDHIGIAINTPSQRWQWSPWFTREVNVSKPSSHPSIGVNTRKL